MKYLESKQICNKYDDQLTNSDEPASKRSPNLGQGHGQVGDQNVGQSSGGSQGTGVMVKHDLDLGTAAATFDQSLLTNPQFPYDSVHGVKMLMAGRETRWREGRMWRVHQSQGRLQRIPYQSCGKTTDGILIVMWKIQTLVKAIMQLKWKRLIRLLIHCKEDCHAFFARVVKNLWC